MASGWQKATYFRKHGRELVSKPAIPSKKSWGGYRRTTHWQLDNATTTVVCVAFALDNQRCPTLGHRALWSGLEGRHRIASAWSNVI